MARAHAKTAVQPEDRLRARTAAFRRLVDDALALIARAADLGRIGVSYSGGKDSTVLLDLVRRVVPEAPAAFFDSGAELTATPDLIAHYGAQTIHPRMSFPEMARYSGWLGYDRPVDRGCPFDVKAVLITEPAEAFIVRERLRVGAIGLRAEESKARRLDAATHGTLWEGQDRTWRCCPIQSWSVDDVWAYLASRALRYHPAYDAMTALGIPRREQRLGATLGTINLSGGRFAVLRRIDPPAFARLAADFPEIRSVS